MKPLLEMRTNNSVIELELFDEVNTKDLKKSYVVYDKKYPEKVQGLFDLASMSILFLIQILVGAGLITMGTFLWSYISG